MKLAIASAKEDASFGEEILWPFFSLEVDPSTNGYVLQVPMAIHRLTGMGSRVRQIPIYRGYANYADILFLPWHWTYLAVYEQILRQNAIQIANQYPQNISQ